MQKTLDTKLAAIRNNPSDKSFIIADARDADMAFGIAAPGSPYPAQQDKPYFSMQEFLDQMREISASGYLDILLASVSSMSVLAHEEDFFKDSALTPAIRANDTTDVWISRVADYRNKPSRPFRTAQLREAMYGSLLAGVEPSKSKVDLGLYSMTFNNDLDADYASLEAFRQFREEAAPMGFRYFLEVFAPNVQECGIPTEDIPSFVNDALVRALAGVSRAHWPEFLKIPYFGPAAMEELASYDSGLVVGILGGGAGTTFDAFKQLEEAKKYGARVALYGRKIKHAEHPLSFVKYLRAVADEALSAKEAVKAYHGALEKLSIKPVRTLEEDMQLTAQELSYAK